MQADGDRDSPVMRRMRGDNGSARERVLAEIEALGLNDNLRELEVQGFTVVEGALSEDRIERAKAAILRRVESKKGSTIDPASATAEDFNGMAYQHYLIFDDPVFPEILLEPKPLALITYLLGESCVLSSMGCHFRGPGGLPLGVHADGVSVGMTEVSHVANCNYALTPYSREAGALVLFPGSHRRNRQPTPRENWTVDGATMVEVLGKRLEQHQIDALEWTAPPGAVTMDSQAGRCGDLAWQLLARRLAPRPAGCADEPGRVLLSAPPVDPGTARRRALPRRFRALRGRAPVRALVGRAGVQRLARRRTGFHRQQGRALGAVRLGTPKA